MTRWTRCAVLLALLATPFAAACDANRAGDAAIDPGTAQVDTTQDRFTDADARITARIQSRFFTSDAVKALNIDVDTNEGVVTLHGSVPTEHTRQEALQLARNVEDVKTIRDELSIGSTRAASAGSTQTSSKAASNSEDDRNQNWITTKIQAQYYVNPGLKPWNIDVTTSRDGIVTLAGTIDNDADRAEAVRIARQTDGVTDVRDQLRVEKSVATTGTTDPGGVVANQIDRAGSAVSDGWITAKIQSKYFLDSDVKGRKIDVDTNNGVVTLRGTVQSSDVRRQAVSMATNTDGVREVRDELRVEDSVSQDNTESADGRRAEPVDDAWITTKVQSKFYIDDQVRVSKVDVSTKNGTVTLNGTVASDEARQSAEQLARETDGVKSVVNNLQVTAGR